MATELGSPRRRPSTGYRCSPRCGRSSGLAGRAAGRPGRRRRGDRDSSPAPPRSRWSGAAHARKLAREREGRLPPRRRPVADHGVAVVPGRRARDRQARRVSAARGSRFASRSGRAGRSRCRSAGLDGLMRVRGGVLHRLLHVGSASRCSCESPSRRATGSLFGAGARLADGGGVGDRADARSRSGSTGHRAVLRALPVRSADRAVAARDPGPAGRAASRSRSRRWPGRSASS